MPCQKGCLQEACYDLVVVAVAPSIGCKVIVVTMEMRSVHLGMPCQKGCMQEACYEEFKNNNYSLESPCCVSQGVGLEPLRP
jgi:hypothetical protein